MNDGLARRQVGESAAGERPAVRGFILASDLRALRGWLPGGLDDLLDALSADERALCRSVRPTAWVPLELIERLLAAAAGALNVRPAELADRLGVALADQKIASLMGVAVRARSPELLVSNAGYLWVSLYSPGEATISLDLPSHKRIEVHGGPPHGPAVCGRNLGFGRRALEMTGATAIRIVHFRCISGGDPHCAYDVQWGEGGTAR